MRQNRLGVMEILFVASQIQIIMMKTSVYAMHRKLAVLPIRFAMMRTWLGVMRNSLAVMRNQVLASQNLIAASQTLIVVMAEKVRSAAMVVAIMHGKVPPSQNEQGVRRHRGARTRTAGAARRRR